MATEYPLSSYDIENIRNEGTITRTDVELWLDTHAGDFQVIDDFRCSISIGKEDYDFNWSSEEGDFTFNDCMYSEIPEFGK